MSNELTGAEKILYLAYRESSFAEHKRRISMLSNELAIAQEEVSRLRESIKGVRNARERWEGKFHTVKNENNKLRKRNSELERENRHLKGYLSDMAFDKRIEV